MNTTKIKRKLAEVGIGNPLNRLVYTTKEIEEMRKRGKIISSEKVRAMHQRAYKRIDNELPQYLVGYEPELLYGADDRQGNTTYVYLMSKKKALKEVKRLGSPEKGKIYKIEAVEVEADA